MPVAFKRLKTLLLSNRWLEFVESTSLGLQVHLHLLIPGRLSMDYPKICPLCGNALHHSNHQIPHRNSQEEEVISSLMNGLYLVVRELPCCKLKNNLSLPVRAEVAGKLLKAFQHSLEDEEMGGRRCVELSTLRQMNHIVLSMFQGDEQATARALDLILASLIIMLDAEGSWLEYSQGIEQYLITKGKVAPAQELRSDSTTTFITADFSNSIVSGKLGVVEPSDLGQAKSLLPLLAQELTITFEIEHLFNLVREQMSSILGSLNSGLLVANRGGIVTYANPTAEKLLNLTVNNLLGSDLSKLDLPWNKFLGADQSEAVKGNMDRISLDGDPRWIDWQLNPLYEGDTFAGWVILIDDRTDYHKLQEVSQQAERFEITATLVGTLAHELRNPLTAAMGLLQLTAHQKNIERSKGYLDLVTRELERINRLLSEFLLLGRPAKISGEVVYLDRLIEDLQPVLAGEISDSALQINYHIQRDVPIIGDTGQLTQVLMNLVRNAMEALEDSGTITITVKESNGCATLIVEDTGPGLPPELIDQIFQPFFTTKDQGTGLGLAVIKAIVNNHGGRIIAGNDSHSGAIFTVELPCYITKDKEHNQLDVLLIMHNDIISTSVVQILHSIGYRVLTSPNFDDLDSIRNKYTPALLITETEQLTRERVDGIKSLWPGLKTLGIGHKSKLAQANANYILPLPVEYVKLLETTQQLIGPAQ